MKSKELKAVQPFLERMASLALQRRERGGPTPEELARVRTDLRKQLVALKAELGTYLTERESYLALFPLVVHLDEIVQTTMVQPGGSWAMLQKEFFETDKGGGLFYTTLEDILEVSQVSAFILQIYYFCLSLGFQGKNVGEPEKIASYKARLERKLTAQLPASVAPVIVEEQPTGRVEPVGSYYWYYAAAAALVIAVYILFDVVASHSTATSL